MLICLAYSKMNMVLENNGGQYLPEKNLYFY